MTASTPALSRMGAVPEEPQLLLGGYAALAESAWMGAVQASEVLETVRTAPPRRRAITPQLPRFQLTGLLTRELSVAEASFILMVSFFLSAALGAVRQVLFNAQFGVGAEANAYYAAFRLPDTLFSLIAGGALSSAMIPVLVGTVRDKGESEGWYLTNLILTALLAIFSVVVLVGEIFTPAFVQTLLAPGFDAATSQLTTTLTRIMLVQPLILAVGSVATAVLNSRNQFVLTALSVASHNLTLIAGILAARANPSLGIYGPTLGVVFGAVLQVLILLPGLRGQGRRLYPIWNPRDPQLREVARLLIPNGLAVGVNYVGFIVDTAFASKAPELAGLPALYNAWLLVGLPIALLGQAVGQATFPRLAAHAAAGDWRLMRRMLLQAGAAVVALAIPALLVLVLFGQFGIQILFVHGEFTEAAGDLTYRVLIAYAVGLPAYVATEVITRGLIATRDTRTPLVTNLIQLGGRALVMMVLITRIGVIAIPVALAVTATVEMLLQGAVLLLRLGRRIQRTQGPPARITSD